MHALSAPPTGVDVLGPPGAPALVFLHAASYTRKLWLPQTRALSGEFRTVALDLPGHGAQSDLRFSFRAAVERVACVLDQQRLDRALLVGVSLGGCVAVSFAAQQPHRVAGLVLSGCTFDPQTVLARLVLTGESLVFPRGARCFTRTLARFLRQTLSSDIADEMIAAGAYWNGAADAVRAMRGVNFRARLAAYPGPTLILNGEQDWVHRTAERSYAQAAQNAQLEIVPGASHVPSLDEPSRFTDAVRGFAARVSQD